MDLPNENLQKRNWHDKYYKLLLIIPAFILLFSLVYVGTFYSNNGDFFYKDISLTGGTSIGIYDQNIIASDLKQNVQDELDDLDIREIYDQFTKERKGIIIQTKSDGETAKKVLEDYLGYGLNQDNSSLEFTGASLSQGFYKQLLTAIIVAFIFMGIVIFIIFRNFIPSIAVILAAFADILMTLAVVDILEIKVSTAGIVAFLMLIGYSVDTDILLTNRVLKRSDDPLNKKFFDSFKTGITMTLTAFFSILVSFLIVRSFSPILAQIFTILLIGLVFDMINTWITNVSILKWYMEKKHG